MENQNEKKKEPCPRQKSCWKIWRIIKRLLILQCLNDSIVSTSKGLNDRIEILNELRFYLRYEQKLLEEGWMTESDFFEIVDRLIREYAAILLQEWQLRSPA